MWECSFSLFALGSLLHELKNGSGGPVVVKVRG